MSLRIIPAFGLSFLMALPASAGEAVEATIDVRADHVLHKISPYLTGACIEDVNHEIYGGIYSQMIFGESFQEPPRPASIIGFETYGGAWHVKDDVVDINATDGPKLISNNPPFKDGAITVDVRLNNREAVNAGLILRVQHPGKGADKFIGYEIAVDAAHQSVLLARHRNNFEPIKSVHCEVPLNRWLELAVNLNGSTIEILIDGKPILKHDDKNNALAAGSIGLRGWHSDASFRNLRVRTGDKAESLTFKQAEIGPDLSAMWRAVQRGNATGRFRVEKERPFVANQSQRVSFVAGEGAWGIENQGLNRWGLNIVEGKPYEGVLWVKAEKPASIFACLQSRDGGNNYAQVELQVTDGAWQRIEFLLTPGASDHVGRFALELRKPGSVVVGYAFLQPGEWGRFKGLPVRREVAEGLIDQGITVLRYGGSMVNNREYKWTKMIGPRDRRPPYSGTWYPWSSNGWGIVDFMNFCEAAGFEYVPAFNIDETPEDMARFIEYAKGAPDSEWGRKRVSDGHEKPYKLRYVELGNEEGVDVGYAAKFAALAKAIWAKDPDIIPVVGDFAYGRPIDDPMNISGAASRIKNLAGQRAILALARETGREVWFDVHIGTETLRPSSDLIALPSFINALEKIAAGAKFKVVVFEYNAGNHAVTRALGNALATNVIMRDGRLPIVTSANCLQPDHQNDNGWDQGLLFLNPSKVWLQPPGYVTQMLSRNYLPQLVESHVSHPLNQLDVVAKRSEDRKTLVLQVLNLDEKQSASAITFAGFTPIKETAEATTLTGPLNATNSAAKQTIVPRTSNWKHDIKDGKTRYTFPPHSFTILRFE